MSFVGFSWLAQHLVAILTFGLTLVFVSELLRQRRAQGSTAAWLLVIVMAPYVGIPLYLLLGSRKLGAASKGRSVSPPRFSATPADKGTVERLLLASGAYEKRDGNSVELIADGVEAFERLLRMIDGARREIHITTFILGRDEVAAAIIGKLEEKARAGVQVSFVLDGFGVFLTNGAILRALRAAGGRVASFLPLFHLPFRGHSNLRNHRKLIVVDGAQALVGGMNLAREYMGPVARPDRWVDLALHVRGPVVADLERLFRSDWAFASRQELLAAGASAESATSAGPSVAQLVASGPDVATDALYDGLLTAIFEARRRIWIVTPYFIPDETLTRALELACRRGADVRVLVPARSNHLAADLGRGSYLRQLADQGARIFLHPRMVHAKATLIDDAYAIVGSANTDMRSFFLNFEVSVFLSSKGDIEALDRWYGGLSAECREGYPAAAFGRQTLEGVCRILSPLL